VAKKAKKAKKRATLLYAGVYHSNTPADKLHGRLPCTYKGPLKKHLGTFDTQKQAAQAIAAVIGNAAGGGLHLRPQLLSIVY
jgi:hypothetical protein